MENFAVKCKTDEQAIYVIERLLIAGCKTYKDDNTTTIVSNWDKKYENIGFHNEYGIARYFLNSVLVPLTLTFPEFVKKYGQLNLF